MKLIFSGLSFFFSENTGKTFKLNLLLVLVLKSKALYYEFESALSLFIAYQELASENG